MVQKPYDWEGGAKLGQHSKCKHKILRKYFAEYLNVRCKSPRMDKFRVAVVDGFAGGGIYECGSQGSPLIFVSVLNETAKEINLVRKLNNIKPIQIECLLILNDLTPKTVELLKINLSPLFEKLDVHLTLNTHYQCDSFENIYTIVKQYLHKNKFNNVVFNLDQCGHSHINKQTIIDIMKSFDNPEIFYTFVIDSLLAFLNKSNPDKLIEQTKSIGFDPRDLEQLTEIQTDRQWLGTAENIVFDALNIQDFYVSPFSINNPKGWRYWFMHFAKNYRGRQVYNDILHDNSNLQAHFGRSGLRMLSYDPKYDEETSLYLFNDIGRSSTRMQLPNDIPGVIEKYGDAGETIDVDTFYKNIYNETPAHMDDIHTAIFENPDLKVYTENGGERQKSTTIGIKDVIKIDKHKSFSFMYSKKH